MPTLGEVFGHIFNRWMAASAFEQVRAPHFERYGESFDLADPAAVIEIHMPVRARGG